MVYMVYIMTHPGITSVYIKGKNVRVTMELEVPKRPFFMLTLSTNMDPTCFVVKEPKEVLLLQKAGDHDRKMLLSK